MTCVRRHIKCCFRVINHCLEHNGKSLHRWRCARGWWLDVHLKKVCALEEGEPVLDASKKK